MCTSFFKGASLSGQVRAVSGGVGILFTYTKSLQWRTEGIDTDPLPTLRSISSTSLLILEILLLDMNAFGYIILPSSTSPIPPPTETPKGVIYVSWDTSRVESGLVEHWKMMKSEVQKC